MKSPFVVLVLAAGLSAGCEFARKSSTIAPSPTDTPTGGSGSTPSLVGTWSSQGTVNDLPPQVQSCTNFQWNVASQTASSISGSFTATCTGGVGITGTGTGELMDSQLAISITGTVGAVCNFTLTGNGYYENNQITVAFSGTSCYGPFSGVETLRRGSLPGPPPEPPALPPPPPPPPPPPANTVCAFPDPEEIVECVADRYPERLAPVGSLQERQANMMFIRDRIIEGGLCAGFQFGWNLKRGGPELSIDFLAWRRSDGDMGVDIAFDYDNIGNTLRLQWHEAGLGATFLAYPAPSCGG
jgi:hypothetical protein